MVDTEWLDMDNQLEAVVGSIDNIRSRLPMESRILHTIKDEGRLGEQESRGDGLRPWVQHPAGAQLLR